MFPNFEEWCQSTVIQTVSAQSVSWWYTEADRRLLVKYVALLAFNRIVVTHPSLVAQQEDVILECIDSADITIRIKALDLVQGMVSSENLESIVSRLMRQLKASISALDQQQNSAQKAEEETDSSDEASLTTSRKQKSQDDPAPLPDDYTFDVIGRILYMCSHDNYGCLLDFEWYLDVLTQLVRISPAPRTKDLGADPARTTRQTVDISEKIGNEVRNVAVKVKAMRSAAIRAAELIIARLFRQSSESASSYHIVSGALKPVAYVAGEYAYLLPTPDDTLGHLLHLIPRIEDGEILATCLQALIKLFSHVAGSDQALWIPERKSAMSLLMARMIHVLEPLASHPYLEVQERVVEFTELLKLTAEAASGQASSTNEIQQDAPLLLTQAIPSLFNGWELNSVAQGAQKNVPLPGGLDLDEPVHPNLSDLLAQADSLLLPLAEDDDEFAAYYNQKPPAASISSEPAILRLADTPGEATGSYQQAGEETYLDADIVARRKAERLERNRDDPFYIQGPERSEGTSTPIHNILLKENGPDLDIDAIPVMKLDLAALDNGLSAKGVPERPLSAALLRPNPRRRIVVAADESLGSDLSTPRHYESENNSDSFTKSRAKKLKQSLLHVDSSHLSHLDLDANGGHGGTTHDPEQHKRDEAEMAQAMKEVQKIRLEMQRANERIQAAHGVPTEGIVVKRKKKTKADTAGTNVGEKTTVKMKKKKKPAAVENTTAGASDEVKIKKKKTKRVVQIESGEGVDGS